MIENFQSDLQPEGVVMQRYILMSGFGLRPSLPESSELDGEATAWSAKPPEGNDEEAEATFLHYRGKKARAMRIPATPTNLFKSRTLDFISPPQLYFSSSWRLRPSPWHSLRRQVTNKNKLSFSAAC